MSRREPLFHWPSWPQLGYAIGLGLLQTAWFAAIYGGANWFTAQREFRVRVHFEFERDMPLVPELVIAYLSLNPLLWLAPFILRTRRELEAFSISLACATAIAGVGFLLFPAEAIFPPARSSDLGGWQAFFNLVEHLALQHNYLPSLHVAFATICALTYSQRASGPARLMLGLWWSAIVVSTLLIHQHYIMDVVTGLGLGWAMVRLVYRRLQRQAGDMSEQIILPNPSSDPEPPV